MYLHLNYTTTILRKTITMKITIFIIVPVWKSNETGKFDISDYHSLFEDVHNVRPQLSHKLEVF